MNRAECFEILNDKNHPQYKEFHHLFYTNRNKCREHYSNLGLYKPGMVLHHKVFNCDNYEEWKIDEIEPMEKAAHSRLHMVVYKQGLGSEASNKKAHEKLADMYHSGELRPWNYGKKGVQVSVRKGKTGKDFPFLCASKKGKSGGWNRGLHGDPRCQKSEATRKYFSDLFKQKDANGKNDKFKYACRGTIFINNGVINKRIKKELPIPDGWVRGRLPRKKSNKA